MQPIQECGQGQGSIAGPIWGGVLGSAVGLFAGGLVGVAAAGQDGYGAFGGLVVGAVLGEAIVMPLGVHHGNRKQGKLGRDLFASMAISGLGLLVAQGSNADGVVLPLALVLQIGATVATERYTGGHTR